jgi:hypothetical protein
VTTNLEKEKDWKARDVTRHAATSFTAQRKKWMEAKNIARMMNVHGVTEVFFEIEFHGAARLGVDHVLMPFLPAS